MKFVDIEIVDLDLSKTTWSRVHSAMRTLYLRLTREPETGWVRFFHEERESRIMLKRHGLWIEDGYIVFDCLLDDVEPHHLPDFRLSVAYANTKYSEFLEARREAGEQARDDVRAEEDALIALRARIRGEGNAPPAAAAPLRTTSAQRHVARIKSLTAGEPASVGKASDISESLNESAKPAALPEQAAAASTQPPVIDASPSPAYASATATRPAAKAAGLARSNTAAQIPSDPLFAKTPAPATSFEALAKAAAQATAAAQALEQASASQQPAAAAQPVVESDSIAESSEAVVAEPAPAPPQEVASQPAAETKAAAPVAESSGTASNDVADFNAKREEWRARFRAALAASREKESARGND